jgi:glycosyltransferase involved in cell wall biosynthesis
LRLLIVSQYFWPENFRVNDLVTELVTRGHEVTVLTGIPNYPTGEVFPEFKRQRDRFAHFAGAKIVRVPLWPRGRRRLSLLVNYASFAISASLVGSWKLRGCKFDAIFAFEPSPITVGIPAACLRASKHAPLALWVLDLWPDTLQALGILRSGWWLNVVGRLVSFIYSRCDLILAQSRSFIPQIKKYSAAGTPVIYFPSWAEAVFTVEHEAPAQEVPLRPGSFDVLFAGNIGEAQDFPAVLAAAAMLKSETRIRWLIVGDGRMAGWLRGEIERLGLQNNVLMLGRYPLDRMPSFYQHADALLLSLKDEPIFAMTIPGKLQSYLAAGIPIVAMLNGEGAEVVERSGAGVTCRAGDSEALAKAVMQLSSLPAERVAEMAQNALRVSRTEFDRARLITQLETWLAELVRNRSEGISVT